MTLAPGKQQLRFIIKPMVFVLAIMPLTLLCLRVLNIYGAALGPNPIETVQDYLGIWGLRFILISLAITPVAWLIKKPWPIRLRRMLGLFAFTYCSLHFLAWLVLDQSLDISAIVSDVIKRPFITLGTLALLLLIPLAVTSTKGWQKRLGARWVNLHRLVYPAAVLVCWHYYWQVKLDTIDALVYCAVLGVLLGVRLWKRKRL
ncbi:MAG: sulfoxide reductase heme-binding subunit YedZ [Gammaproteobacteria bacterium]|jgi:sulfoxide reductase heme-binding subunit YedZ